VLQKLGHRLRIAKGQGAHRADHHHLPAADWAALAILLLQQPARFGLVPQQKLWIGPHLRFQQQLRKPTPLVCG
jgi:hypothetical protein